MAKDKPLLQALKREDRGIKDDAQFSPYYPSEKYIVFFDYGHPDHLGSQTFRTKKAAKAWIETEWPGHNRCATATVRSTGTLVVGG